VPTLLVALWLAYGGELSNVFDLAAAPWPQTFVAGYVLLCCLVTYLFLPSITIYRHVRRPRALAQNHTRSINFAAQIGFDPVGHGKYRHLARLPFNQAFEVDFAEKVLHLPNLPAALDGLSILHLSDLHFGGTPDREFYLAAMDVCHEWDPDILAITGDVVDSDHHHRWILPVLSRLRWRDGAFAILGNHDTWYEPSLVRRRLRKLDIDVIGNSWKTFDVRGEKIVVIGNEGPWISPISDLKNCPEKLFRLCLSHTPDNLPWARRNNVDLVLAGHCHGGQVRIPGFGSILVPSRFGRRYDCGTFDEPPTVLHVVRGLAAQHPLRYNCRPEIAKLILQRAPAPSH
jgi:predicted MPP superfamily phosphohydrolase